jgi:nucleotide-binding universal stress UspA family protein
VTSRGHRPTLHRCLVVGYDGTPAARAAAAWAARQLDRSGRLVIVVAVKPQHGWRAPERLLETAKERTQFGQALADELFLEGDDLLCGVDSETEIVDDAPVPALLATAAGRQADAIVLGSRHHDRLQALRGSVSRELLPKADRPVFLIPAATPVGASS